MKLYNGAMSLRSAGICDYHVLQIITVGSVDEKNCENQSIFGKVVDSSTIYCRYFSKDLRDSDVRLFVRSFVYPTVVCNACTKSGRSQKISHLELRSLLATKSYERFSENSFLDF